MTLKNYILNGPSVVIEDDDRDPHVSWRNHLERTDGKRAGVDLVAKVGTPIYAPTDGVMDWRKNDGSAGNSCRFVHDDNKGWKDVFSHLSAYVGKDMQRFKQGELIAYSGNSGGVTQHLHRHLLDPSDVRQNPWDHFTPAIATVATETAKPIVAVVVARILEGETMIVKRSQSPKGEVAIFGADFAEADGSKRGRHVFASKDEYNAYKAITDTVRREGGAAVTLPAYDSPQIVGLDETGWRTVCNVHGV